MLNKEQLEKRALGIGGTDCAAILGVSQYSTPLEVYQQKVEGYKKPTTPKMTLGSVLEPFVFTRINEILQKDFEQVEETFFHKKHNCLLANVDAISKNEILEIKTSSNLKMWGSIPSVVDMQVRHYLSVCEKEKATLCSVLGDEKTLRNLYAMLSENNQDAWLIFKKMGGIIKVFDIFRDEKIENEMNIACVDFWENNVLKKIPPQAKAKEDLKHLKVQAGKKTIINISVYEALKKQKEELDAKEAELKQSKKDFEKKVIELIGDSQFLTTESGQALAVSHERTTETIDKEKLKQIAPEIFSQCLKKTTTNVLKIGAK